MLGSINKNKVRIQISFARNLNSWLEKFKNFCSNPWNSFWGLRNTSGFFTLYSPLIKGYQKYNMSKMTVQSMRSKFRCFNFDLSYFLYSLRYRVIQYLIGKPLVVVNKRESCGSTLNIYLTCGWEAALALAKLNNVGSALFGTSMPMWRQNEHQKSFSILASRDNS